jgi:hypothetical protein
MRKLIYLGFLTLTVAVLFRCAGMPGSYGDSSTSDSFILNGSFKSVVYEEVGNQNIGLIGNWMTENKSLNRYSVIGFDQNNNFVEQVRSALTHEIIVTYKGSYNVNADALEIASNDGGMRVFSFNINANLLQLSAK